MAESDSVSIGTTGLSAARENLRPTADGFPGGRQAAQCRSGESGGWVKFADVKKLVGVSQTVADAAHQQVEAEEKEFSALHSEPQGKSGRPPGTPFTSA